jgi:hypothetical protein
VLEVHAERSQVLLQVRHHRSVRRVRCLALV